MDLPNAWVFFPCLNDLFRGPNGDFSVCVHIGAAIEQIYDLRAKFGANWIMFSGSTWVSKSHNNNDNNRENNKPSKNIRVFLTCERPLSFELSPVGSAPKSNRVFHPSERLVGFELVFRGLNP